MKPWNSIARVVILLVAASSMLFAGTAVSGAPQMRKVCHVEELVWLGIGNLYIAVGSVLPAPSDRAIAAHAAHGDFEVSSDLPIGCECSGIVEVND